MVNQNLLQDTQYPSQFHSKMEKFLSKQGEICHYQHNHPNLIGNANYI